MIKTFGDEHKKQNLAYGAQDVLRFGNKYMKN